jgi:hypothetical protein
MSERNDHDLAEQFAALRRADAAAAPSFHATLTATRARDTAKPRRRALGFAAAIVIVGVAIALFLTRRAVPTDLATVRLKTPTDFLLMLPNEQLLRTVPHLGRVTITSDGRTP